MDASSFQPAQPSRLRLLPGAFFPHRGQAEPGTGGAPGPTESSSCASAPRSPTATALTPSPTGETHISGSFHRFLPYDWGVPSGHWLNLDDEPDRSGPVRRLLHGLGAGLLARAARRDRHRRQDRAPQPRPVQGAGRAASGLRLRHGQPAGARAGGGRRQEQRDDRHPSPARKARRRPQPRGRADRIDAIACNPPIAQAIRAVGADYCSPSKATSRPSRPTSRPPSKPPPRARSRSTSITTRATAASRPAPSPSCARSTGSTATGAFPARSGFATRAPSSKSKRGPS